MSLQDLYPSRCRSTLRRRLNLKATARWDFTTRAGVRFGETTDFPLTSTHDLKHHTGPHTTSLSKLQTFPLSPLFDLQPVWLLLAAVILACALMVMGR